MPKRIPEHFISITAITMGCLRIASNNAFFNDDYIIVKAQENYITISKPTMDFIGKTQKIERFRNRMNSATIKLDVPLGVYEIDFEDSTEDELIIYLDQ